MGSNLASLRLDPSTGHASAPLRGQRRRPIQLDSANFFGATAHGFCQYGSRSLCAKLLSVAVEVKTQCLMRNCTTAIAISAFVATLIVAPQL
jgi:hypothetical protein